jgi:hypothetical protein
MKRLVLVLCAIGWLPAAALADPARYFNPHPIPAGMEGKYCYVQGSHLHDYLPPEELTHLFRECGGHYCFVGDPLQFGYEGEVVAYEGHHPIYLPPEGSYCYLYGLHYHPYYPHPSLFGFYGYYGGLYRWRGPYTWIYQRDRARYDRQTPTYTNLPAYRDTARRAAPYYTPLWRARMASLGGRFSVPALRGGVPRISLPSRPAYAAPRVVRPSLPRALGGGRRR